MEIFSFMTLGVFISALVFTILFTYLYRFFAEKIGIISNINYRSLHEVEIPRGTGIIFGLIFFVSSLFFCLYGTIDYKLIFVICVGGLSATLFGFFDDIYDVKPIFKLSFQILLSFCILFILYLDIPENNFNWFYGPFVLFILVWLLNVFNFMDGIDGLAASGTLLISWIPATIILYQGGNFENILLLYLLGLLCFGFLFFNFPKATVHMGDSGSLFLGYIISALSVKTILEGDLSLFVWLIIGSYFLTDTTMTTIYRIFKVNKWYGAHRSHAYQNLAYLWKSHLKVTSGIVLFHLFWLLPLSFLSVLKPELSIAFLFLAVIPVFVLNLLYGPNFSED